MVYTPLMVVASTHGPVINYKDQKKKDKVKYGTAVSFRTTFGKFICAEPSGLVVANRDAPGPWEAFSIVNPRNPNDYGKLEKSAPIALRTNHGTYLSINPMGQVCVSPMLGLNESFVIDSGHVSPKPIGHTSPYPVQQPPMGHTSPYPQQGYPQPMGGHTAPYPVQQPPKPMGHTS